MDAQKKSCQSCKENFTIAPEDFDFYKKIGVPPPTFCPQCRMIRRFMIRNERTWYKRTCAATGKNILSMFSPDKPYTVYELNYWKSDAWDPLAYGRDYDFSKPFFAQYDELFKAIPHPNLVQKNCVSSDYSNYTLNLKNCYYCASNDTAEDSCYLFTLMLRNNQCVDGHLSIDCERSYEFVDCNKCSNIRFCQQCEGCVESWLLYDCRNCTSCVGCVGLRGKQYCIFNEQYSKEDYKKKLEELNLGSHQGLMAAKKRLEELKLTVPRKYAAIINSENAIGEDIRNSRNVHGFAIKEDSENVRYGYRIAESRDIWDGFIVWLGSEMQCETMSCQSQRTYFSALIWGGFDIQYSYNCFDCNNIFGCIGLRNKSYCILNKQYTKEEYEALIPKIIEQMKKAGEYGEFFPESISPFAYNETIAQDYFPLTKAQAQSRGFAWKGTEAKKHQATLTSDKLPENIKDVTDDVLKEIIACAHAGSDCAEQCAGAFKLIPLELQYYRQFGVPLPRLCPSCRHFQRIKQKPPLKLWHRSCMCNQTNHAAHSAGKCANEFETPYAPERPETIYCESCYNSEIA